MPAKIGSMQTEISFEIMQSEAVPFRTDIKLVVF
jgi:hypothetical protein